MTANLEQVPQRLRYRGYWDDAELGTYWLGVRQYDPALKQFLQADPSQQEGLAAYAYAHSDPVDGADPSGLVPCGMNRPCDDGGGDGGWTPEDQCLADGGVWVADSCVAVSSSPPGTSPGAPAGTLMGSPSCSLTEGVSPAELCSAGGGGIIGGDPGGDPGPRIFNQEGTTPDGVNAEVMYDSYVGTETGDEIDASADDWYGGTTLGDPRYSLTYHWDKHADDWGTDLTPTQYTQKALQFYADNAGKAQGVQLSDGTTGLEISYDGTTGIYKLNPDGTGVTIVTLWGPGSVSPE